MQVCCMSMQSQPQKQRGVSVFRGGKMSKTSCLLLAVFISMSSLMLAQQFPPGYVDPAPILAAASKAINEQSLRCITFSGVGYSGPVGQTFENAVNID